MSYNSLLLISYFCQPGLKVKLMQAQFARQKITHRGSNQCAIQAYNNTANTANTTTQHKV